MNSNFSPLPQNEFPNHVTNLFILRVYLGCMVYISFVFMTSFVHYCAPIAFFLDPYATGLFGLCAFCIIHYLKKCFYPCICIYLFCFTYVLVYYVPDMYIEWSSVSTLAGLLSSCIYVSVCQDTKKYFIVMGSMSTTISVACNTLYF